MAVEKSARRAGEKNKTLGKKPEYHNKVKKKKKKLPRIMPKSITIPPPTGGGGRYISPVCTRAARVPRACA